MSGCTALTGMNQRGWLCSVNTYRTDWHWPHRQARSKTTKNSSTTNIWFLLSLFFQMPKLKRVYRYLKSPSWTWGVTTSEVLWNQFIRKDKCSRKRKTQTGAADYFNHCKCAGINSRKYNCLQFIEKRKKGFSTWNRKPMLLVGIWSSSWVFCCFFSFFITGTHVNLTRSVIPIMSVSPPAPIFFF